MSPFSSVPPLTTPAPLPPAAPPPAATAAAPAADTPPAASVAPDAAVMSAGQANVAAAAGQAEAEMPWVTQAATDHTRLEGLYRDVLGRDADPVGLDYYAARVGNERAAGLSDAAIFGFIKAEFQASPEAKLRTLYLGVLGREPDARGINYWIKEVETRRAAGVDESVIFADVAKLFADSAESTERLSHAAGVTAAVAAMQAAGLAPADVAAIRGQMERARTIRQLADKDTCVATISQIGLAVTRPEVYANVMTALIQTDQASFPGADGNPIAWAVSPVNRAWIEAQGFTPAERASALFQVAFSEDAARPDGYDVATDTEANFKGLSYKAMSQSCSKAGIPSLDPRSLADLTPEAGFAAIEQAVRKSGAYESGVAIPIRLDDGSYHLVRVLDADKAALSVDYLDPVTSEPVTVQGGAFWAMIAHDVQDDTFVGSGSSRAKTGAATANRTGTR